MYVCRTGLFATELLVQYNCIYAPVYFIVTIVEMSNDKNNATLLQKLQKNLGKA